SLAIVFRALARQVPSTLVSALEPVPFLPEGTHLGDDEILLDSWAAEDLGVEPGDPVEMSYFLPGSGSAGPRLRTAAATLRVRGTVPLSGLAVDRTLTPAVAGI